MPEFRKIMKRMMGEKITPSSRAQQEEITPSFQAQQQAQREERSAQVVYEDAVLLARRRIYTDLAKDKALSPLFESVYEDGGLVVRKVSKDEALSPLFETVRELIGTLKKSPNEIIAFAHTPPKDEYIPRHVVSVSIISLCLGIRLALDDSELQDLGVAGLLHCIGRPIGTKDAFSCGIHLETKNGYINSVEIVGIDDRVKRILKGHHESMGPNIYPLEEIVRNLETLQKILSLVDCYCTLLHHPILKKSYYPYTSLQWIVQNDGDFGAEIVKALMDTVGLYPIGSWVELSTHEIGEVIAPTVGQPMKPVVKVFFESAGKKLLEPRTIDLSEDSITHIKKVLEESEIPEEVTV